MLPGTARAVYRTAGVVSPLQWLTTFHSAMRHHTFQGVEMLGP